MNTKLMGPRVVPDTPDAEVLTQAMSLISTLAAPTKVKQLISDLEEAANANRKLIETATALKSEIDQHEREFSERQAELRNQEVDVIAEASRNFSLNEKINSQKANLELRESTLIKRQADFLEKQERTISYIDGVIENLRLVKQGFCNV